MLLQTPVPMVYISASYIAALIIPDGFTQWNKLLQHLILINPNTKSKSNGCKIRPSPIALWHSDELIQNWIADIQKVPSWGPDKQTKPLQEFIRLNSEMGMLNLGVNLSFCVAKARTGGFLNLGKIEPPCYAFGTENLDQYANGGS
ncbi:hypothetical protein ACFX14_005901 [Malus domestica]